MTNPPGGEHAAPHALITDNQQSEPEESAEEAAARDEAARKEAADSIIQAFGGVRGMIDMTLPGLVFIVTYNLTHQVSTAAWGRSR